MKNGKNTEEIKIGFIGQGWIGKNYADTFTEMGYDVTRYDISEQYSENKNKIGKCDIVFIAVPTPTTPQGFDDSIVQDVIKLVGDEKIAVIKSTIKLGTTEKMQKLYPNKFIFHSPEFLSEATAAHDARNPDRNIVGYTEKSFKFASKVMSILPSAPYEEIVPAKEAELVKYANNVLCYMKVLTVNLIYDLACQNGIDFDIVRNALAAGKFIGKNHLNVVHKGGRGAGGNCFIKDFAAFREMYTGVLSNNKGSELLKAAEEYNKYLLLQSGKNLDLLNKVYGCEIS